jgi:hypothetical protein
VLTVEALALRPKRERRHAISGDLHKRLREHGEASWTAVYPLCMRRDISRPNPRDLIRKGLEACLLPFREYRR